MAERDKVIAKSTHPFSKEFGYRHIEVDEQGMTPLTVHLGYGRKINFLTRSTAFLGNGIRGKERPGMPVIMLHTEGTKSLFVAAYSMKPNHLSLRLVDSDNETQTVKIGETLFLENTASHVALRDSDGRLIEITK